MDWWWLGEVGAPECLPVGCLSVFVLVQTAVAAAVPGGGAAGGALIDTEGPDVALV